jgi:hypothetical protein
MSSSPSPFEFASYMGTAQVPTYWPVFSTAGSSNATTWDGTSVTTLEVKPHMLPPLPAQPEVTPETNLDWLHRRVDEMRELARVA